MNDGFGWCDGVQTGETTVVSVEHVDDLRISAYCMTEKREWGKW